MMGSDDRCGDGSSMGRGAGSEVEIATDGLGDAWEGSLPCHLDSLEDLARWRDEVLGVRRRMILGTADAADSTSDGDGSPAAGPVAISALEAWLAAGIDRMRENGELAADADPARLATGLTAALSGGSLLARATRDIARLEVALDVALSCVRSHSAR
jgi:hypothetical protein